QCAQSCRLPYDLVLDGQTVPLGEVKYLLSPQDLAAFRAAPDLAELGVHTLKIEGRYKGPAYVISAVEAWRRWIDAVVREGGPQPADEAQVAHDLAEMAVVYSRGFGDGFLGGADHQHLVEGRFPKHRGLLLGQVTAIDGDRVEVAPHPNGRPRSGGLALGTERTAPVAARSVALPVLGGSTRDNTGAGIAPATPRAGMGVVFDQGNPQGEEPGGPIFAVEDLGRGRWRLGFGRPGPRMDRVRVGDRVWLTGDPAVERRARKLLEAEVSGRVPLRLVVAGSAGQPLQVEARAAGFAARAASPMPLEPAAQGGLTEALLRSKLGAVGNTPFDLLDLDTRGLSPGLHLPVSALKALRREVLGALLPQVERGPARTLDPAPAVPRLRAPVAAPREATAPTLIPLCRTEAHLEAVLTAGFAEVELDWMERAGLERAVERARAAGLRVHIATPRVQKPGEEGFDRRIARLEPEGVLVRHFGALVHFDEHPDERRPELHGDFSLNVTNSLTAGRLLALGLDTLTAAHDLDAAQLFALLPEVPRGRLAVTVHHHIPTFHTEHCVYAHLLSDGRDIRSCGQPCQDHLIELADHQGLRHPVVVDPACRNTVYNAQAQSAASLVPRLLDAGVRRFRVEFVREDTGEALRILAGYQALLRGDLAPRDLLERLR
ncbi:MAG: DUF3656 domain-containing protein, partial [Myxococcales bacterium]|nr:DUF3656 domain-containing protein [Myxococcales bacterium]